MTLSRLAFAAVLLAPVLALAHSGHDHFADISKSYLDACGGKSYNTCDQPDRNQETLFEAAVADTMRSGRLILLEFGADWCPSCRMIDRDFKAKPELLQRLQRSFAYAKINGDVSSGKNLARKISFNYFGYPTQAIFDPAQNKVIHVYRPAAARSTEDMVEYLEKFARGVRPQQASALIGDVRESLLKSDVRFGAFGGSRLSIATQLSGAQKQKFDYLVREGMAFLHAFHWIKAAQAFNGAIKIQRQPLALALLAIAYDEIETIGSKTALALVNEAMANSTSGISSEEAAFSQYARARMCEKSNTPCEGLDKDTDGTSVATELISQSKVQQIDLLAFLSFATGNTSQLETLLAQDPRHAGVNHYLTHMYESSNKMNEAAVVAKTYAELAADSAHAQHMYGHILPQIGDWPAAAERFARAHAIHQDEFKRDGIKPHEDWHYSHNLDLYASTLVYLNRTQEAERLFIAACKEASASNPELCFASFSLEVLNGRYAHVKRELEQKAKAYLNHPGIVDIRILLELGLKNLAAAKALVESLKATGDYDSIYVTMGKVAYELISGEATNESELLAKVEQQLKAPGFDSWSSGVMNSRMLARVLRDNGRAALAERVERMAIGVHQDQRCKTSSCRR